MKTYISSALALLLSVLISQTALANQQLDDLLTKIDADIAAKRLSSPAGNNAIDKIWQFKTLAPYDQRINNRTVRVGKVYVALANKAMAVKKYSKAQLHLDKVWMLSYLTPGLDTSQDKLDKVYKSKGVSNTQVAQKPKPVVKKQTVAKKDTSADKALKAKQLAAAKAAKAKAEKELAARQRQAEQQERRLAQMRKEEENKRLAAQKLAALEAKRMKASAGPAKETSKSIADFDLDQNLIDNRETRNIRTALVPICEEIIENDASVVLHTQTKQDYRWLTVRLTLCVRRIDSGFRLRHSFSAAPGEPSISLHPGRNMSLLKRNNG